MMTFPTVQLRLPSFFIRWFTVLFLTLGVIGRARGAEVCVRTIPDATDGDITTLNGVVATGTAGPTCAASGTPCAARPVWGQIAPNVMTPEASSGISVNLQVGWRPTSNRLLVGVDLAGDPRLSEKDYVYLFFDADNGETWNDKDFYIRLQLSPSVSVINTGAQCCQALGIVEYYRRDPAGWALESCVDSSGANCGGSNVAAEIKAKLAYDHDTAGDTETNIHNLEVSIPRNFASGGKTYYQLSTGTPYFAIGAYAYVDTNEVDGTQVGFVSRWPDAMKTRGVGQHNFNSGNLPEAPDLANANLDNNNCFDVTFVGVANPWDHVNGEPNPEGGDPVINKTGDNNFKVRFKYNGPPGAAAGQLSNKGTVEGALTPYTAGTPGPRMTATSAEMTLLDYSTGEYTQTVSFPPSAFGASVDHVCAEARLNFQRDDDTTNNSNRRWTNFGFTPMSTRVRKVALFGGGLPNARAGQKQTVYLNVEATNDPAERKAQPGLVLPLTRTPSPPDRGRWLDSVALLGALGLGLVAFASVVRGRGSPRFVLAGSLLFGVVACCHCPVPPNAPEPPQPPGEVAGGRWRILNAAALGVKPVKGMDRWYTVELDGAETKVLEVELRDAERLPYTPVRHKLAVATQEGGPGMVKVKVAPNQVVTVLAFGKIDPDGPNGPLAPVSAAGTMLPEATVAAQPPVATQSPVATQPVATKPPALKPSVGPAGAKPGTPQAAAQPRYLLQDKYYRPKDYVGTLVGSFDGFKTSFVIGTHASIVAPAEGGELSLAANYALDQYRVVLGGVFELVTIVTPAPQTPTHAAVQGTATFNIPFTLPPWRVLTTVHIFSYFALPPDVDPSAKPSLTLDPWGAAHLSVFESHVGG